MKEIIVGESQSNQRLDKFLLKYFNNAPKSFIYKMLRKKRIKYNKGKAAGGEIISAGDVIELYISPETQSDFIERGEISAALQEFEVLYEDGNILAVGKPAGLLCHPDKENENNTLIDQIIFYLFQKGEYDPDDAQRFTPGLCNRLDRNTSGIVIAGKNMKAMQSLNEIIKSDAEKSYFALVAAQVSESGVIRGYIVKNSETNESSVSRTPLKNSREATTFYKPVYGNGRYTLLDVKIRSGKSHQIRAHLKYEGFPIVGDKKYGEPRVNSIFIRRYGLNRQFLHNHKVVFGKAAGVLDYLSGKEIIYALPDTLEDIKNDILKR